MHPILKGKIPVMGQVAVKPRPTLAGIGYCLLYLGVPIGIVGSALDLAVQLVFGVCVGLWCVL
ncbi:MAG: hypothetical protein RLY30_1211 [Pseudomonadota bacterium]